MANYGKVRYVESYEDAPATAEYIFRKCSDGFGILQRYTENDQLDLYRCWFEENEKDDFQAMLVEVRSHMPADKLLYVQKPSFMYTY